MSTRSNIAIEDPKTKKVKVIYVHSDGYPYGVGKCLVDYWDQPEYASQLFDYGDASYLGDTIEECSFYGRDWDRDEDPAKEYRDEWMYMHSMRGDFMIEYVYLFKDNRWHVSTGKTVKVKDGYDNLVSYWTKFEPVALNKEYINIFNMNISLHIIHIHPFISIGSGWIFFPVPVTTVKTTLI